MGYIPFVPVWKKELSKLWLNNQYTVRCNYMLTSSNGNIFRVTGPLCGEFTSDRLITLTKASDVFFDQHLNKRLSKQSWGCWFVTPSRSLWRHCNELSMTPIFRQDQFCAQRYMHTMYVPRFKLFTWFRGVLVLFHSWYLLFLNDMKVLHIYIYIYLYF